MRIYGGSSGTTSLRGRPPYSLDVLGSCCFHIAVRIVLPPTQLGIAVGHLLYFLEFVYPEVAQIRGWNVKQVQCSTEQFVRRYWQRSLTVSPDRIIPRPKATNEVTEEILASCWGRLEQVSILAQIVC